MKNINKLEKGKTVEVNRIRDESRLYYVLSLIEDYAKTLESETINILVSKALNAHVAQFIAEYIDIPDMVSHIYTNPEEYKPDLVILKDCGNNDPKSENVNITMNLSEIAVIEIHQI